MENYSDTDLLTVAKTQKQILRLLCASILACLAMLTGPSVMAFLAMAAVLLLGIMSAVLIYRLAGALKEPLPWLYLVLAFVPYASVAALLIINAKASAALKTKGIRVGLMGARPEDLEKLSSEREGVGADP